VRIIVSGRPAPQGSKRHIGKGRVIEQSKAVGPWRGKVTDQTRAHMLDQKLMPFTGPVDVQLRFRLARPKDHYRTGRNAHLLRDAAPEWPSARPDLDKLARAVLDGLTAGGAWHDDGQAAILHAAKQWATPGRPEGCIIEITSLPKTEEP
jgi:crossover junction endodeoxyribonuclease RusA